MDADIAKIIAKAQGKSVDDVRAELKEAQEAEIRGEKITIPHQQQASTQNTELQASLPLWGDRIRGVPNSVLRSALFTATKRGKRAYLERVEIASVDKISVLFTGPRLDQADLDVWEQCLHIARTSALGTRISFTAHAFLKAIGRNTSGANHEWLKGAFARLAGSVVELKDGKRAYFGALISHGERNDATGHFEIEINPKIASLYNDDGWTGQDWEQRKALQGKPLALWLHGFYSSHAQPFDYKIETLHKLCGSETSDLNKFKQSLKQALADLSEVTSWLACTDKDKVQVFKTAETAVKRLS